MIYKIAVNEKFLSVSCIQIYDWLQENIKGPYLTNVFDDPEFIPLMNQFENSDAVWLEFIGSARKKPFYFYWFKEVDHAVLFKLTWG